ncbi:MAG: DUF1365 domain-containing protein [Pseudomonadota bacterium]
MNSSVNAQPQSAIYTGVLTHRRDLAPAHRFAYRMRLLWLDLDEVETLFAAARGWSLTRPALGWLRRRDYLRADTPSLKLAVADEIAAQLATRPDGPIRMLTAPRVFGIGFNPLTLYYCYDRSGTRLQYVLAEVRNTPWLQRHCYALDLRAAAQPAAHDKHFHVSPFLPMDMQYHWQLNPPDEQLNVQIRNSRQGVTVFRATLALQKETALEPQQLQRELWRHWPQGLKTLLGIYWQAVKLFGKRARFHSHPGNTAAPAASTAYLTRTDDSKLISPAPESLK